MLAVVDRDVSSSRVGCHNKLAQVTQLAMMSPRDLDCWHFCKPAERTGRTRFSSIPARTLVPSQGDATSRQPSHVRSPLPRSLTLPLVTKWPLQEQIRVEADIFFYRLAETPLPQIALAQYSRTAFPSFDQAALCNCAHSSSFPPRGSSFRSRISLERAAAIADQYQRTFCSFNNVPYPLSDFRRLGRRSHGERHSRRTAQAQRRDEWGRY